MFDHARLHELAQRVTAVPGVVGVALGGSRARGDHGPDSDVDLGLYYRPPLDVVALRALAHEVTGVHVEVTEPGAWGPWVDGGAWLSIDGTAVDWIYRDLDRVRSSWKDARAGRLEFHFQVGHPLGVPGFAYAGVGCPRRRPGRPLGGARGPPARGHHLPASPSNRADRPPVGGRIQSGQRPQGRLPCGHGVRGWLPVPKHGAVRPRLARARGAVACQRKGGRRLGRAPRRRARGLHPPRTWSARTPR